MSGSNEQPKLNRPGTDDEVLRYTRGVRLDLVDELTKKGVPTDTKDQQTLLQTLSDMDRGALSNKKIGASEGIAEADRIVAVAIAQLNNQFGSQNPFERRSGTLIEGEVPRLDAGRMPEIELVEGETEIGLSAMTYNSFIEQVEGKS